MNAQSEAPVSTESNVDNIQGVGMASFRKDHQEVLFVGFGGAKAPSIGALADLAAREVAVSTDNQLPHRAWADTEKRLFDRLAGARAPEPTAKREIVSDDGHEGPAAVKILPVAHPRSSLFGAWNGRVGLRGPR
jgi:hypothetical protein